MQAAGADYEAVVRRIYEGWAAGDFSVAIDLLDPHVMFVVRSDFPESGVFTGPEGVREYMRRFLDPWKSVAIAAEEFHRVGDTFLVRIVQRGTGRASGIEAEMGYFQLITFRGDRIIRIETVMGEAEARTIAGLPPSA